MKNKKGFTLIELLAIIVILAIIAVITVPIILNVIENSKKGAAIDSAYGYKDAVNKFYVTKLSEDSTYNIPDGDYTTDQLKTLGVSVSGKEPGTNSWVTISKNNVSAGCLQFDEYKVTITDGKVVNAEKGECRLPGFHGIYIAPENGDTHKGIVYLDPADLSNECDDTNYDSTPGVKTGCMKFYIFDENEDGTVDMILDHNTSLEIPWTLYQENGKYVNYNGPREALYQLYEDTKNWSGISDLAQSSNYTATWKNSGQEINLSYTIDYTKHLSRAVEEGSYTYTLIDGAHKARFITAEEVADIINKENFKLVSGPLFYLDSKGYSDARSASNPSDYAWLFENLNNCEQYGCKKQSSSELSGNIGYMTGSPSGYDSDCAWNVDSGGYLGVISINYTYEGIRPVITVSKTTLGID